MFINKQKGIHNKDLEILDLDYYLAITKDYKSEFKPFNVIESEGFKIIDESTSCPVGFKARGSEFFIQRLAEQGVKELVYVQPRRGFAGISLAYMCERYGMDLTLVMPASKKVSPHQLYCIELGAKPLFLRIAAMPNANAMAARYAKSTGAYYVPLGLDHPDVIAGAVRHVYDFFDGRQDRPKKMWSVISTGVLQRSLQIALPDCEFVAVAVARNIQQGELGRAEFMSYHKPFNSKSEFVPTTFDCEPSYDSKGYDLMREWGDKGDWFFSVAGHAPVAQHMKAEDVDSYRDWNDLSDFKNVVI